MKMREVCARTGLTDRTVRYWTEQGLLNPYREEQNGRLYFLEERFSTVDDSDYSSSEGEFEFSELDRVEYGPAEGAAVPHSEFALISADGTETVFPFRKTGALRGTWEIFEASFDGIPEDAEFARMEFRFEREGENFRFVNLEHPRLFFREAVGEKA